MIASFRVASAPLRPDGTFSVQVPDLAADPVVSAHDEFERGWLQFVAREPETGNIAFFLKVAGQTSSEGVPDLPIASSHPRDLQFDKSSP